MLAYFSCWNIFSTDLNHVLLYCCSLQSWYIHVKKRYESQMMCSFHHFLFSSLSICLVHHADYYESFYWRDNFLQSYSSSIESLVGALSSTLVAACKNPFKGRGLNISLHSEMANTVFPHFREGKCVCTVVEIK